MELDHSPSNRIQALIAEGLLEEAESAAWEEGDLESIEYLHGLHEADRQDHSLKIIAAFVISACFLATLLLTLPAVLR